MTGPVVVVGAGQAAASFITRHLALANPHPLLLIGEESYPPYQRPPLSKKYLMGELEMERLFFRPLDWYAEQSVTTRFDTRVTRIDRDARQILTDSGESIAYDKLLLCTGSSARRLSAEQGGNLENVFTLRSIADIARIAPSLRAGKKLLIVGGGYIGLEAAASARKLGLEVTLLEMAERILQRVAAAQTSAYFRRMHCEKGVDLRESVRMRRLLESGGRVSGAELESGEIIEADLVLVGIGGQANSRLAEAAGLECDNGIAVNQQCRSSDASIYAAGDCCSFIRNGNRIRLESVQNAADQGDLVARVLGGEEANYDALPWFWSDQYDCKLQIVGLNQGHTLAVARQGEDPGCLSVWYYADDRLIAIDAMNDTRAYAFGKKIIEAGKHPTPSQVTDPATDLKAIAKS